MRQYLTSCFGVILDCGSFCWHILWRNPHFCKTFTARNVSHGKFYRLPQYFKALLNLFRALAEVQLISDLVYNSTLSSTLHYREYHRLCSKSVSYVKFLGLGSSWVWEALGFGRVWEVIEQGARNAHFARLLYNFPNTSQTQELPKPKNFT